MFVRLLHLSLKFRLPKMSRNEKPSWLRSQNSEYPRIFRVITGANKKARKLLFTDLVNTNKQYVRRALILLVYQVSLRMCQVTKSFRQRGDSRIYPSHWKILRWLESGCQQMRLPPLFRRLGATFCGKYTEVEIFFKEQQNQTVKSSRSKSTTVRFFRLKEKRKEHSTRR